MIDHRLCACAQRRDVEAAGQGRQQPDVRQRGKAPADARVVVERWDSERVTERPQPVCLSRLRRLGEAEKHVRDAALETGGLNGLQCGDRLHERLGRSARLGDDNKAGSREVERPQSILERDGVEVIVEAGARPPLLRRTCIARNVPACELCQRLAAKARASRAEENDGMRTSAQARHRRPRGLDVVRRLGDAQQRQAVRPIVLLEVGNRRSKLARPGLELVLFQAGAANGAFQAAAQALLDEDAIAGLANGGLKRALHCSSHRLSRPGGCADARKLP